jgi:hypothetical protein
MLGSFDRPADGRDRPLTSPKAPNGPTVSAKRVQSLKGGRHGAASADSCCGYGRWLELESRQSRRLGLAGVKP